MIVLTVTYCMLANADVCYRDQYRLPADADCERSEQIARGYMREQAVRDVSIICGKEHVA